MADSSTDKEQEELKAWYKSVLDALVPAMIKHGAVEGAAVEAAPFWAIPHKMLIAKVWNASQKSQFVWAIAGKDVATDHVPGSMAATPRDAARHFALKWQMDAERLLKLAQNRPTVPGAASHMKAYTDQLVQYAETLYDLTDQPEAWR